MLPTSSFAGRVNEAAIFAAAAHAAIDQRRKYTGEPYVMHAMRVAQTVQHAGGTDDMVAASYLHDTVEDTAVTIEDIRAIFGPRIAELVGWLTDTATGTRKERAVAQVAKFEKAPADVCTIKLADMIDNTRNIVANDPKFARVYLAEKELLLPALERGNFDLWKEANNIMERSKATLKGMK